MLSGISWPGALKKNNTNDKQKKTVYVVVLHFLSLRRTSSTPHSAKCARLVSGSLLFAIMSPSDAPLKR